MEAKIYDLLDEKFAEEEFTDCFLIELKLHANNKLDIFIDSDTGITFDRCRKISRYLESYLDESGWLGERYTLEVSSPGVSRPLQLLRQYPKHIGRKLKVKLKDGSELEGTLTEVGDDQITLERKVVERQGKRKKHMKVSTEIPFGDIDGALVQISFK
ncbi:ribosome assembly cofactor RimP [Flavilitoribacter nigricans]|uniref:Ribosome maturation factor RimP n=1 Tax=Flavilitoribacter nigricans (strain ATCC 23147 / DSM 23189 / NBRC 102662 / NCIMB 1420 / SS-2) TaxID=1122177 RepID=A0A2D0N636_FLAN2|nr:ribosome assembly cofactor RimP [Flavilitoribacter nigricans]PHN03992.1 ribosome maturation factor [Flavilitoribacter nigricans DSM 23189 = NBRC 102662]